VAGRAASDLLQTVHPFQKFGIVRPWHTTATAARRAGDPMTGDRDPTGIVRPTDRGTGPTGAVPPTSPAVALPAR
jgi:hypothetical protein